MATVAHVGLLLLVDLLHVVLQMRQLREGHLIRAQLTAKGFLARVLAYVQLQHARVGEGLMTDLQSKEKVSPKTIAISCALLTRH